MLTLFGIFIIDRYCLNVLTLKLYTFTYQKTNCSLFKFTLRNIPKKKKGMFYLSLIQTFIEFSKKALKDWLPIIDEFVVSFFESPIITGEATDCSHFGPASLLYRVHSSTSILQALAMATSRLYFASLLFLLGAIFAFHPPVVPVRSFHPFPLL